MTLMEIDAFWVWLALGIVLLGLEITTSTLYLLWPGLAALLVSAITYVAPETPLALQITIVAASTILGAFVARTYFGRAGGRMESDRPNLNNRAAQMIGMTAIAAQDFTAGAGAVRLGDTQWAARLIDGRVGPVAAGARLVVKEVRGAMVIVDFA